MQIIISPAKKMNVDVDSFSCQGLPQLLPKAEQLYAQLRNMSYDELKGLWKCNDQIARLNYERLQTMNLRHGLTPAILSYEGIQYQYMAPGVFTDDALVYVQAHLRILSGFYGILRPFDGVTPYRLEMQAKLKMGETKDLYGFWGREIAGLLFSETDCILNLASQEYSRCVSAYISKQIQFITCMFCERKNGKLVEKGTLCKMARGEMVRFLAEHQIESLAQVQAFDGLGYRYIPEESNTETYVFIKEK